MPKRSRAELVRLDAAARRDPDTSDIPERNGRFNRVVRDSSGQVPAKSPSPIRDAILAELGRRHITRQHLWRAARKHCPSLPEVAVYEFLRGQRQLGVVYVDALLVALNLVVKPAA